MVTTNFAELSKQDLIKKVSELAGINCSLNWDISRFKEVNERLEKEILDKDKRIEALESDENRYSLSENENPKHDPSAVGFSGNYKTLRDEFAAMIFGGYIKLLLADPTSMPRFDMKGICKSVYPLADFMMEGR